ncbi:alpha-ribazole phosphatase [Chitinophaga terrae (ex Kim and Jung 2007)]|uniref:alpha-ribazole phosphatase family protein n=1 Tax=Chitinophaga terrae (ex Kim and Jung 2007) TaxID=408074 RepID=UPI0027851BFF|nr:alpha-ribazole phosphatase family protein [Chitinophaga terrae (ex Kim and Jung 2007)]MDQ0108123.1 alpha-ribazole phosphatase [Chitinophaga terrae (ex Kim and Jung 2007)]
MEIYLIRHTTPAIESGVCYGASDVDVAGSFETEAAEVKAKLPARNFKVVSSPSQRCVKLARALFGDQFSTDDRLMEMNFGNWEMQPWDSISKNAISKWADNVVFERIPGGETYEELFNRSIQIFEACVASGEDTVLITHGGVIRCILALVTDTALVDAFDLNVDYGKISGIKAENGQLSLIFRNL